MNELSMIALIEGAARVATSPTWECTTCLEWQPALDEQGARVQPRPCARCGGRRHERTVGLDRSHKPIVRALAAKGWNFDSPVKKWAECN